MTLVVSPYSLNPDDGETVRHLAAYLPKFERLDLRTMDVESEVTPDRVPQIPLPVMVDDVHPIFQIWSVSLLVRVSSTTAQSHNGLQSPTLWNAVVGPFQLRGEHWRTGFWNDLLPG